MSNLVNASFRDALHLYKSWMPFIKNGGLFLSDTRRHYEIGSEVFIMAEIPGLESKAMIQGKMVWYSPGGAMRPAGYGFQFLDTEDNRKTRAHIEKVIEAHPKTLAGFTL